MSQQLFGEFYDSVTGICITTSQPTMQNLFSLCTKGQTRVIRCFAFAKKIVAFFYALLFAVGGFLGRVDIYYMS